MENLRRCCRNVTFRHYIPKGCSHGLTEMCRCRNNQSYVVNNYEQYKQRIFWLVFSYINVWKLKQTTCNILFFGKHATFLNNGSSRFINMINSQFMRRLSVSRQKQYLGEPVPGNAKIKVGRTKFHKLPSSNEKKFPANGYFC